VELLQRAVELPECLLVRERAVLEHACDAIMPSCHSQQQQGQILDDIWSLVWQASSCLPSAS
jgi:hypothetical protein